MNGIIACLSLISQGQGPGCFQKLAYIAYMVMDTGQGDMAIDNKTK